MDLVGSALARLTTAYDAYRWICGGVQINYHILSDFRVEHGSVLNKPLTENVDALMAPWAWLSSSVPHRTGVRVRASAGAAFFRRE
jgi:hypothetical protein